MATTRRTRVLIVEDHQMVREGLVSSLGAEEDMEVVGQTGDGAEAVEIAEKIGPDIVLMDITLRGLSGIDATARIRKSRPDIQVLVLSMHDDAPNVARSLQAGARGYVSKGQGLSVLCEAIRAVRRGEVYLSPDVSDYVLQGYLRTGGGPAAHPLTDREREVLHLIAEGYTARQIAERLGLTPKTVDNHRARIMQKLDIHTTAGLVRYAFRTGQI